MSCEREDEKICPDCGKKPWAGRKQTCPQCHRIASRVAARHAKSKPKSAWRDPPVNTTPDEITLGVGKAEIHRLALARMYELLASPKTPMHIMSQMIKVAAEWEDIGDPAAQQEWERILKEVHAA